ncbi:amidase signature enzyme [Lophiostoma macrostomum CBS 122681]|uniref:Amidase signature enzyme n=1 Tax=Lophiostoma macrostomum CBS 122681 TaxID=1314788 RepID=A0A6A6T5I4_9PLEO|nr:amidase signature enzyme [Lophiostoma macrostomum CBS 122681]
MSKSQLEIPSLLKNSLSELRSGLDQGHFTSVDLVRTYLERIREVDCKYNSIIETNPDALNVAHQMDSERARSRQCRPLLGIPILLKDNIVTLDSMESTAGSMALIGAKPSKESAIVTALRRAGAIILGKTNMAEWSGFRSTSGCSGWSARGGQAYGPFCENMKASGSSTGSATAMALGLASAALGTEACYSVVSPAERSGVVGFKPTRGLLPSDGIIHASAKEDTVGVITQTVHDAISLVEILSSHDPLGDLLITSHEWPNLSGIRIGIPTRALLPECFDVHSAKQAAFSKLVYRLSACGATIVPEVTIPLATMYAELPSEHKEIVLNTDMKTSVNKYLSSLTTNPNHIHSLTDLIAFTKSCPVEEYPARNVARLEAANATSLTDPLYKEMLKKDDHFATVIPEVLRTNDLHVLVIPSLSVTLQTFAAKTGSPVMSVPISQYPEDTAVEIDRSSGLVNVAPGIPFSVYIFGDKDADENVANVGYACERVMGIRERLKPYVLPNTDLGGVVKKRRTDDGIVDGTDLASVQP